MDAEDAGAGASGGRRRLTGYCHSGMGRAALFLGRKFGALLRELCEGAGFQVALAGHSLGAGEPRGACRARKGPALTRARRAAGVVLLPTGTPALGMPLQ